MYEDEKEKKRERHFVRHLIHAIHGLRRQCKDVVVFNMTVGYFVSQLERFGRLLRNVGLEKVSDEEKGKKVGDVLSEVGDVVAHLEKERWREYVLSQSPECVPRKLREILDGLNDAVRKMELLSVAPIVTSGSELDAAVLEDFMELKKVLPAGNEEFLQILEGAIERLELSSQEEAMKFLIDLSKIQIQKSIGSGGFAEVFLGYNQEDGTAVAVKMIRRQESDDQSLRMFEREVEILARMKHFAVLPFVGACRDPMCIITQFMSGGSLYSKLHNRAADASTLASTQLSIIALGIAYGMSYIHSHHVIHRDLKSLNIMLDENDMPKICDFGMARMKTDNSMTMGIGTAQWMAPEVISGNAYNEKADVYSYGIILWEMLTGDVPFNGMTPVQVGLAVVQNKARPRIPKTCPANLKSFIELCWDTDPNLRPDFPRIVGALETGAITFPGTDMAEFKEYVDHHSCESEMNVGLQMPENRSGWNFALIATLQDRPGKEPENMTGVLTENDLLSRLLVRKTLVFNVLKILRSSDDDVMVADLIPLLAGFLNNEEFREAFIENSGESILMHVLLKFNEVLFVKLIDCFSILLTEQSAVFERRHLVRLSCFLLCVDLTVRVKTIQLLEKIVDLKLYKKEDDFGVLIENLLRITIPEARSDLLMAITKFYLKIFTIPQVLQRLRGLMGPETICALLCNDNLDILDATLLIMTELAADVQVRMRTWSFLVDALGVVLPRISKDDSMVRRIYHLIGLYLSEENTADQFVQNDKFFSIWKRALSYQAARIEHLRLSYRLCLREDSRQKMVDVASEMCQLMLDSNQTISSLAAMNLAAILSSGDKVHIIADNTLPFVKFMRDGLRNESQTTIAALLLVGVLTKTPGCIQYVEEWDLQEAIVQLLGSANPVVVMTAMKQIMAISSVLPEAKGLSKATDLLFTLHNTGKYGKYPIQCITNLTVMPDNAANAAKYAKTVLSILKEDPDMLEDAITIIYRIVTAPESDKYLDHQDLLTEFVEVVAAHYTTTGSPLFVSIISHLITIPSSRKIMKDKGVLELINKALSTTPFSDPKRPELIKIRRYLSS